MKTEPKTQTDKTQDRSAQPNGAPEPSAVTPADIARAGEIVGILESEYPEAHCELNYGSVFQLLVAVILSAQCTDRRVNVVTESLFKEYPAAEDFAALDPSVLEQKIYSCGFYRNKAKNIIAAAQAIVRDHGGEVPASFDELLKLPGVGRKTANVVFDVGFGGDGIAVDTHVFRTSARLGLAECKTPYETERRLTELLAAGSRARVHHLLIFHGRYRCKAINPKCGDCRLQNYCKYYAKKV